VNEEKALFEQTRPSHESIKSLGPWESKDEVNVMKKYQSLIVASFLGIVMFVSGCATTRNMLGTEYRKESVPNSRTYFSQVWAVADDDGFRISGKLRLKGPFGINVPDYVEVALIDEAGNIIDSRKVGYYPRILSGRRKHREARFTARFEQAPPSGTVIRLENVN